MIYPGMRAQFEAASQVLGTGQMGPRRQRIYKPGQFTSLLPTWHGVKAGSISRGAHVRVMTGGCKGRSNPATAWPRSTFCGLNQLLPQCPLPPPIAALCRNSIAAACRPQRPCALYIQSIDSSLALVLGRGAVRNASIARRRRRELLSCRNPAPMNCRLPRQGG